MNSWKDVEKYSQTETSREIREEKINDGSKERKAERKR
jgi:hypothetical protein